jgi:transcriptional regulator with PAS, ATPase and Fis domain
VPTETGESKTKLTAVERSHIIKILKLKNGNRSKAAEELGIHRRQLYRLL